MSLVLDNAGELREIKAANNGDRLSENAKQSARDDLSGIPVVRSGVTETLIASPLLEMVKFGRCAGPCGRILVSSSYGPSEVVMYKETLAGIPHG